MGIDAVTQSGLQFQEGNDHQVNPISLGIDFHDFRRLDENWVYIVFKRMRSVEGYLAVIS